MFIRVHSWLRSCLIGTLVCFVIFVVRIYFPLSELRGHRVLGGKADLSPGITFVLFVVNPLTSDEDRRVFHKPQSLHRGGSAVVMFAMKPHIQLAETTTPDGKTMTLVEHDGDFSMRVEGRDLMHSSVSASELHLGEIAVEHLGGAIQGKVLIGGLGMGFTLRSVLDGAGKNIEVDVVELIPEVVEWNRTFMKDLNGARLDDPRVTVHTRDVCALLNRCQPETYDAILLDIDNGPTAMVQKGNARLYNRQGLQQLRRALKPGGRAAIWSASVDTSFEARLKSMNFKIEAVPARLHKNARRSTYTIYVADKV